MLRRNIAAPSLKILWKNLNSVKCYDKSNMNIFTLSQWGNFRWGLIYFDQFIKGKRIYSSYFSLKSSPWTTGSISFPLKVAPDPYENRKQL